MCVCVCVPPPIETPPAVPNKHTHTRNNDWLAADKAAVKLGLVGGMNAGQTVKHPDRLWSEQLTQTRTSN